MFIISLVIYSPVCVPYEFRVKSGKQDTYGTVSRNEQAVSRTDRSV